MQNVNVTKTRRLVECALLVAVATVLSVLKLVELPFGGSITMASMLPLVIVAYRHGPLWGFGAGLSYGVIQQLLGLKNLSYFTTWQSIMAVIFLDYLLAFATPALAGFFRSVGTQRFGMTVGALSACFLRYVFHVISGATVWAGLSIPTQAALGYSFGYNATYMIPETIVTMFVGYYIGSVLDFTSENLRPYSAAREEKVPVLRWIAGIFIAGGLVFDITGLSSVSWTPVIIVSAAAAVIAAVLFCVSAKKSRVEAA